MAWRDTRLFNRIADWQSKPVSSWRAIQAGVLLFGITLIGIFKTVVGPTVGDRAASLGVTLLATVLAAWALIEGKS
jgi:hypothetical protein